MNFELQQIKKKYGEKMAHLCRTLFPTILESEGTLLELLENNFEPNKYLHDDIVNNDLTMRFKDYVYSLFKEDKEEKIITDKTPEELLNEAGYDLYECNSEEEIQSFKKYYHRGEELCTFTQGNRLDTDYVFFAVRKDVDDIYRDDFDNPKREDEYGTSVMSIQFSKGRVNTLSIKNRYNHTVDNPDATYGNNLDNIIPGLRDSFENYYNFNIRQNDVGITIPGYIKAKDKKYYKYNYAIDNKYYCIDNIIVDDGEVIRDYQKDGRYLVADYFVIDFKDKTIKTYDRTVHDGLSETSYDIKNIEARKINKDTKRIHFNYKDGTSFDMTVDNMNRIKSYTNENLEVVPEEFFGNNKYMEEITLKNAKVIKENFLAKNYYLKNINIENAEEIGNLFLPENRDLKEFKGNKIKHIGNYFLNNNLECENIELKNIESIGSYFISRNKLIRVIDFPKLISAGSTFLDDDVSLEEANLPSLEEVNNSFLTMSNIKSISLPKLRKAENEFMTYNRSIENIDLPSLEIAGHDFLTKAKNLKEANLSNLRELKGNCLKEVGIKELDLTNIESVGDQFLQEAYNLEKFNAPKLKKVGNSFMEETERIKNIELENLEESGHSFMRFNEIVENAYLPKLLKTGYGLLESTENLKSINLASLHTIGEDSLKQYKLKDNDLPSLTKVIGFNQTDISNNTSNAFYNIIKKNREKENMFKDNNVSNNVKRI